jgi:hypothetical protein
MKPTGKHEWFDEAPPKTASAIEKILTDDRKANPNPDTEFVDSEWWSDPDETKKSEDNMNNDIPQSAVLSKGLYTFTDQGGKLAKIKDDWLAEYVDAFICEAYEHERMETAHQDPNLLPASTSPGRTVAQSVFNEFMGYIPMNKNLARAKDKLGVSVDYVEGRLRGLNLLHVDSENDEANRQAAVAGYHPTPLALSQDAHAAAETERNENLERLGLLQKSDDYVVLGAAENPVAEMNKVAAAQTEQFAKGYGAEVPASTMDARCPFHGDHFKDGLESSAIQGAVCTCG